MNKLITCSLILALIIPIVFWAKITPKTIPPEKRNIHVFYPR